MCNNFDRLRVGNNYTVGYTYKYAKAKSDKPCRVSIQNNYTFSLSCYL